MGMSNYKCCGWLHDEGYCQPANGTSIYEAYSTGCKEATKSDYSDWVMTVTIIFSSFAGFHLLYTCIPCLGQAKRLQMKVSRQEEANKKVVRDALNRGVKPSPRGSWLFRRSPRGKNQKQTNAERELRTDQFRNATELTVPEGATQPVQPSSPSQPGSNPG